MLQYYLESRQESCQESCYDTAREWSQDTLETSHLSQQSQEKSDVEQW